jgi:N-acetyl-gamma-glutamyl-phosphate reductase
MHKIPVGVLGASGYAGRELCALVRRHPVLELAFATANERRGDRARIDGRELTFVATDDAPLGDAALVFSALPHGVSAAWVARARAAGAKVVDLSTDLRPGNAGSGKREAGSGTAPGVETAPPRAVALPASRFPLPAFPLPDAVPYGLPELMRSRIVGADVVANPGCYPTAILLALAPLLARGLVAPDGTISVSAASGVTGAGFTPRLDLLFGEVTEDFRAYAAGNVHRHLNEMRAVIAELNGTGEHDLVFTPHLLPVARGILATITVPVVAPLDDALAPWREHYAGEPFIEVAAEPPTLKDVTGRNVVRISALPVAGVRQPTLLVLAAIDNLVKGAAGQAVQNANLLLGLDEPMGLPA